MSLLHEARLKASSLFRREEVNHREEEPMSPNVDVKQRTCVLLPRHQLWKAREMIDQAWAAQQPTDELERRLLSLKRQGLVGAFSPREREAPNPEQVIFYPHNSHVSDEQIATQCGGEVGIVGIDLYASVPRSIASTPLPTENGFVFRITPWRNEQNNKEGIHVAVGIAEVIRGEEPLPAFGPQKEAMIQLTDRIAGALGRR